MLNHAAAEALYSATYVENYLDCLENLPDDLQRQLSRLRELDAMYQVFMSDLQELADMYKSEQGDGLSGRRIQAQMQHTLILAQEIGDEKLQAVQTLQDLIENQARLLETDLRNLDFGKDQENTEPNGREIVSGVHHLVSQSHSLSYSSVCGSSAAQAVSGASASTPTAAASGERQSKRVRRSRAEIAEETFINLPVQPSSSSDRVVETRGNSSSSEPHAPSKVIASSGTAVTSGGPSGSTGAQRKAAKKKKRKSKQDKEQRQQQRRQQQQDDSPQEMPIDPDEPTYCLCDQISYGEMILCDNDLCPIEWFHFSCVSLGSKPKGKWFCPRCRGDRPNIMKPKAQFLKELERYNKEKEEKA